jgi:hypothetical protein
MLGGEGVVCEGDVCEMPAANASVGREIDRSVGRARDEREHSPQGE